MGSQEKHLRGNESDPPDESSHDRLKVLVVGGPESLGRSTEILDSLLTMGYGVNLLGVIDDGAARLFGDKKDAGDESVLDEFKNLMRADPPDLLIITSDEHLLRKGLVEIIPSRTRVLDSFALKIFQTLKELTGQLDRARNRLETVELMKEVLMAGSEISIMVVDEDLKIQDINNALLKRTKMSRKGCVDRPCHWAVKKTMEPCYRRGEPCVVRDVVRTGRAAHTVKEETRKDKTSGYFTISAYPLKKDDRGKKGVLVVWKDVTAGITHVLDRQVRNIRENFSQLLQQDKLVALGKLAAAAVHEINNPVQGILTFARLMRRTLEADSLPAEEVEKFKTYLDMIATESARCGKILGNLLSFSRRRELNKTSVDLAALLDEVVLLMGNRMDLEGISVNRRVEENLPSIHGDRDQIEQVLLNLFLNSVEAMPDGGVIDILADVYPDSEHVRIRVQDTGTGVPSDIRSNLFEPFFSTKENGKGVGLGLSVVYGIIAQHGGAINVESEDGKGAAFVLILPAARTAPP